jgi:hypothetical protein
MTPLATDWATISSLATGAGTLVLAIATFASVRSSNRSARIAEAALQEQRRPVLSQSRVEDPVQKMMFVEGHWVRAEGGRAVAEHSDGRVYLAMSLRNVGSGIAVCQGWTVSPGLTSTGITPEHAPEDRFRVQTRDMYIPAGEVGMWQGALRNPDDQTRIAVAEAIDTREGVTVELLYTDLVGGQRTITRFGIVPVGEDMWITNMLKHWYLESSGPRPESDVLAAIDVVQHEREAADHRSEEARQDAAPRSDGAPSPRSDGAPSPVRDAIPDPAFSYEAEPAPSYDVASSQAETTEATPPPT